MSSNIKVQRICQHCGKEFTARTTVTQYCTDVCSKRAYKAKIKAAKIEESNKETQRIKAKPIEELKAKEFLTVREVAILLNCSIRSVYYFIENRNIEAVNLGQRITRVKRSALDKLFEKPQPVATQPEPLPEPLEFDVSNYYNITEIQSKYNISETTIYQLIKRSNIPKIKKGKYSYVPKPIIDKLLA